MNRELSRTFSLAKRFSSSPNERLTIKVFRTLRSATRVSLWTGQLLKKLTKLFVRLRRKVDENFNFCTNYLLLRRSRILFFWEDKYGTYFVLFSMQRKGRLLERIFRAGDLGRVVVDHFNLFPAQCFYLAVGVDLQIGSDGADDLLHVV